MPGEFANLGQQAALNMALGKAATLSPPFTVYLALCTDVITDANTVSQVAAVELTTSGYARQTFTWGSATLANPAVIGNSGVITFGPLSVDMADPVTYAALLTVASGPGGNYLAWWQLDEPMQVLAGQSLQIAANNLTMSLT